MVGCFALDCRYDQRAFSGTKKTFSDFAEPLDLLCGHSCLHQSLFHGGDFFGTDIFNQGIKILFYPAYTFSIMEPLNYFF